MNISEKRDKNVYSYKEVDYSLQDLVAIEAIKKSISEKYLRLFPEDRRAIVRSIIENLDIDIYRNRVRIGPRTISISRIDSFQDLDKKIEGLLKDYRDMLKDYYESVVLIIRNIIVEISKEFISREIDVEIKNISEREKLAYELYKHVVDRFIIKTFKVNDKIIGVYCYDDGVYEECENRLREYIWGIVKDRDGIAQKTIRWVINEAMNKIVLDTGYDLHYEPLTIAFKNTLFDWEKFLDTGSIRRSAKPFDPDIVVFHRIPHRLDIERLDKLEGLLKYSENLITNIEDLARELCPKTLKAFRDWVGDKWILLFEVIGYTLYPRYDLHKAIMLVGDGANGKSTYLRLVKTILGPQNVVSIPLQALADDRNRFVCSQLYRKLANIYADLPKTSLTSTGMFKILTGEDSLTCDRKFRDPITFVNYAKLLFSANELPKVYDMSLAFWRRWIIIEFPNRFPIDQTFFERTFTEEEVEGAIIVSLYSFRNVWIRKRFSFEESESDYREKWLRETNSVYAFLQDLLNGRIENVKAVRDPNGRIEADILYRLYVKYCESEEREVLAKKNFTEELQRFGIEKKKIGPTWYYKGIRIESS